MESISMVYSELIKSPLGKHNASPEEIAVWFDLHEMNNAKKIKTLMNAVERNYHTACDWSYVGASSTSNVFSSLFHSAFEERPSSVILRNIFTFMFKTIEMKEKDIDQLIKFSEKKIALLNSKHKKTVSKFKNLNCGSIPHLGALSRLEDLLEVYGEMNDRLHSLRQQSS